MTEGTVLDLVLLLILAMYAAAGYRRGLLLTVVGAVGFLVGAGLGLWILPGLVADWLGPSAAQLRPFVLLGLLLLAASLTQGILTRLVSGTARSLGRTPLGALDAVLGAVVTVAVAAVTIWFSAGVLRVLVPNDLTRAIGQSRVVTAVGQLMPATSDQVLGGVKAALDQYGFPRVFSAIGAEPIRPVGPADPGAADRPDVAVATESVLRIDANASACQRSQEGTGWVAQPGLVVTNAHVVAGSQDVAVTSGGRKYPGRVVAFDDGRDLAVLSVDGLNAPPLQLGRELSHGDSAVVAGYPLGGPLRLESARVREVLNARGDDIYGRSQVDREVYSLLATVQPGNSGGPLFGVDGTVSGVVFARSLDDPKTGYALTLTELRPVLGSASRAGSTVATGGCARS
ncbi:MAG: MarP family serine protease [Dermatophilaceae bacterium]